MATAHHLDQGSAANPDTESISAGARPRQDSKSPSPATMSPVTLSLARMSPATMSPMSPAIMIPMTTSPADPETTKVLCGTWTEGWRS